MFNSGRLPADDDDDVDYNGKSPRKSTQVWSYGYLRDLYNVIIEIDPQEHRECLHRQIGCCKKSMHRQCHKHKLQNNICYLDEVGLRGLPSGHEGRIIEIRQGSHHV